MKQQMAKLVMVAGGVMGLSFMVSCCAVRRLPASMRVVEVTGERVPMTSRYDDCPDEEAVRLLQMYKEAVDQEMNRVVGQAARTLEVYRPESPLSNLVADVICQRAAERCGQPMDMAVMNIGGIRNLMAAGEITVGDIYQISPFQNVLAVAVLRGDVLLRLLEQIAAGGGEGISGAELVMTDDGLLQEAKVGGREVDTARHYRVATIDYVVEGNDGMEAFKEASEVTVLSDVLLRTVFLEHVMHCTQEHRQVDAQMEHRITIKE